MTCTSAAFILKYFQCFRDIISLSSGLFFLFFSVEKLAISLPVLFWKHIFSLDAFKILLLVFGIFTMVCLGIILLYFTHWAPLTVFWCLSSVLGNSWSFSHWLLLLASSLTYFLMRLQLPLEYIPELYDTLFWALSLFWDSVLLGGWDAHLLTTCLTSRSQCFPLLHLICFPFIHPLIEVINFRYCIF